jgi:flavin-dependent thymidylate synthase
MQVELIDYTGAGTISPSRHAANLLVYTKSTRLEMTPKLMENIINMSTEELMFNLRLMADTNPGSWEFVHLSFSICGVTRALTHQLVRTRQASYAQQTMRVLDVTGWKYDTGPTIKGDNDKEAIYVHTMEVIDDAYKKLINKGADIEDARGVLPTNILTNINMSINMRNWINLIRKRSSGRVGNEYRRMVELMIIEVEKIYPWIYLFVKNDELKARKDLQNMIYDNPALSPEEKTAMVKKLDIIIKEI